jgi:hypothetical protein
MAWGPTRKSDKSIPFIREARAAYGKGELGEKLTAKIYETWRIPMDRAGYRPDGECTSLAEL